MGQLINIPLYFTFGFYLFLKFLLLFNYSCQLLSFQHKLEFSGQTLSSRNAHHRNPTSVGGSPKNWTDLRGSSWKAHGKLAAGLGKRRNFNIGLDEAKKLFEDRQILNFTIFESVKFGSYYASDPTILFYIYTFLERPKVNSFLKMKHLMIEF